MSKLASSNQANYAEKQLEKVAYDWRPHETQEVKNLTFNSCQLKTQNGKFISKQADASTCKFIFFKNSISFSNIWFQKQSIDNTTQFEHHMST